MKFTLAILILLFSLSVTRAGQNVSFVWGPSPGTNVVGYAFYACTNSALEFPNSYDTGTNRTVTISNLVEGVAFWLYVKAYSYDITGTNISFSDRSPVLMYEIPNPPPPPTNFRMLIMQESIDLTNWSDVKFWRLKIGP